MAGRRASSDRDAGLAPYLSQIDTEVHDSKRRDTKAEIDFEERRASRTRALPSPHDPSNDQASALRAASSSIYSASAHSVPPSPALSTYSIPSQAPSQVPQSVSESSNGGRNSDQVTLSQRRIVSGSSLDDGDDTGLMVNVVARRPMSPASSTGSVIQNPSRSLSPSSHENGNTDLTALKRQVQDLTTAFTNLQAENAKELEETKNVLAKLRQEHDDLREEHNDYKTTIHWRLQKIEADLNKAFLDINKIRMDMQENLNRQAIDIKKNAEEIALHAKEEWQDAPSSSGDSAIRSLEQKMTELKLEVKALKKAGKRKSHGTEDEKRGGA